MDRRRLLSLGVGAAAAGSLAGCAKPDGLTGLASPAPPASTARLGALRKIAFGSCINQELPQPIWDAILADRPDLFIFGGDNVYASTQPWQLSTLELAYQRLAAQPGFARLRQSVPHLAIWDDHDFGLNDGGAGFPHKLASKQAFMDFWGLDATDPRRTREGIYHAQVFGEPGQRVQVILLDAFKDRMAFPELKAIALKHYKEWEPDAFVVEKKAAGAPLIQELRAMGIAVDEFSPSRGNDKIVRLNAVSDLFASGSVWAPDSRWAREVIEEVASFPNGEHDDYVDTTSQALLRFRRGGFIRLDSDEQDDRINIRRRAAYY